MFSVRVKIGNTWSYSNTAFMETVAKAKTDRSMMGTFAYSKERAYEVLKLLCSQAATREIKALAIVKMSVYDTHIAEREVVLYREFK